MQTNVRAERSHGSACGQAQCLMLHHLVEKLTRIKNIVTHGSENGLDAQQLNLLQVCGSIDSSKWGGDTSQQQSGTFVRKILWGQNTLKITPSTSIINKIINSEANEPEQIISTNIHTGSPTHSLTFLGRVRSRCCLEGEFASMWNWYCSPLGMLDRNVETPVRIIVMIKKDKIR